MFTLKRNLVAAFAASLFLALASAPASAESNPSYRSHFGAAADGRSYDREIVVTADTRWVNVVAGQVVRFAIPGATSPASSFTWSFDTWGGRVADLSQLAPPGMLQRPVKVYIGDDPRYGGQ